MLKQSSKIDSQDYFDWGRKEKHREQSGKVCRLLIMAEPLRRNLVVSDRSGIQQRQVKCVCGFLNSNIFDMGSMSDDSGENCGRLVSR